MSFCKGCSAELAENARFCSNCGMPCEQTVPAEPVAEPVVVAEVATAEVPAAPVAEPEDVVQVVPVAEPVTVTTEVAPVVPVAESVPVDPVAPIAEPVPVAPAMAVAPISQTVEYQQPVSTEENTDPSVTDHRYQQECLESIDNKLKFERLMWKIFGIIGIVLCSIFLLYGILFLMIGSELAMFSIVYLFYGLFLLPIAIVNMIMVGKAQNYRNTLYNDCGPAVKRCGSVGTIVFAAIFNTGALIFVILNFIFIKRKKAVFDEIKRNQDAYNNRTSVQ